MEYYFEIVIQQSQRSRFMQFILGQNSLSRPYTWKVYDHKDSRRASSKSLRGLLHGELFAGEFQSQEEVLINATNFLDSMSRWNPETLWTPIQNNKISRKTFRANEKGLLVESQSNPLLNTK